MSPERSRGLRPARQRSPELGLVHGGGGEGLQNLTWFGQPAQADALPASAAPGPPGQSAGAPGGADIVAP